MVLIGASVIGRTGTPHPDLEPRKGYPIDCSSVFLRVPAAWGLESWGVACLHSIYTSRDPRIICGSPVTLDLRSSFPLILSYNPKRKFNI